MNIEPKTNTIRDLVRTVRSPAGSDPRFVTNEGISANLLEFIVAMNKGMTTIHVRAITSILWAEDQLMQPDADASALNEYIFLWRQVNNYLAWTVLGDRHVIRRHCNFQTRLPLSRANPNSILACLKYLSEEFPTRFSLWTDSTSFMAAGDLLTYDAITKKFELCETKQLAPDEIVIVPSSAGKEQLKAVQAKIESGTGVNSKRQGERFRRQVSRMARIQKIVENDKGIDPFMDVPVKIFDTPIVDKFYHADISDLMQEARSMGQATKRIESCLWVGCYARKTFSDDLIFAYSAATAFCDDDPSSAEFLDFVKLATKDMRSYLPSAKHPLAMPAFLFDLPDEDVADLLTDAISVRMYFDWDSWGQFHLPPLGGKFHWMPEKEYRRQYCRGESAQIDRTRRGVPCVTFENDLFTPPSIHLIRIFTDFLMPSTCAEITAVAAEKRKELAGP